VTEENRHSPLHLHSASDKAANIKYQPFSFSTAFDEPHSRDHPSCRLSQTSCDPLISLSAAKFSIAMAAVSASSGPLLTIMENAKHDTNNGKQAFENTSTSVAASQMRNALNNLADTVTDAEDKKV